MLCLIDFAPWAVSELSWVVNLKWGRRRRLVGALRQVGKRVYWPNSTTLEITEWQIPLIKVRTARK